MSRRSAYLVALAYLVAVLVADVRLDLGAWGLTLAVGGFLAIVGVREVGPPLRQSVERRVRSAQVFAQTGRLVEQTSQLLVQPDFQLRASPEVRATLRRIATRLEQIAAIIRSDPDKQFFADWFLGSYARPIHDLIRHYVTLTARQVSSAREAIERTELELPDIERQLDELFEAIHRGDVSTLKSINEMLEWQARDRGS